MKGGQSSNLKLKSKSKRKGINTYELMQMNRSQFLDNLNNHNMSYVESEFDNYSMFKNSNDKKSQFWTHEDRSRRNNWRENKHSRLNKVKHRSMKDFDNTLKRVKSKQLSQREAKIMSKDSFSTSSNKFMHNLNKTNSKLSMENSIVYNTSKKRGKKSVEKPCVHLNNKYIPIIMKKKKATVLKVASKWSKNYGTSKDKLGHGYKTALRELKNQSKK